MGLTAIGAGNRQNGTGFTLTRVNRACAKLNLSDTNRARHLLRRRPGHGTQEGSASVSMVAAQLVLVFSGSGICSLHQPGFPDGSAHQLAQEQAATGE